MLDISTHKSITREQLAEVESLMRVEEGFSEGDCFPLTHTFADGLYMREIRVPAGNYVVTKIFKQEHATFLLQGTVTIITEEGRMTISAPYSMITKPGTKRLIYVEEDCIWTCVHANRDNEKNVDLIEKFVIAESFEELEAPNKPLEIGG